MSPYFRPPCITGKTVQEQVDQLIRYLHQLSAQLQQLAQETTDQNK